MEIALGRRVLNNYKLSRIKMEGRLIWSFSFEVGRNVRLQLEKCNVTDSIQASSESERKSKRARGRANKLVQLHYTGCQLCFPIGSFPSRIANLKSDDKHCNDINTQFQTCLWKKAKVQSILNSLYSLIDKGLKKKVFHKNTAARKKSKLALQFKAI